MTHEIETKVLDIDSNSIMRKLESLGAKKTRDTRLFVDWYQVADIKPGQEKWYLRIRSDSDGAYQVTWKAKSKQTGIARKHKEINFNIDEPEKLADLFSELGLEKYAHQEKDRKSFEFKDWVFEIDNYPGMPPFLEIEGKSEEHILEGMKLLGVDGNRTWVDGEKSLIEKVFKLDWSDMRFQ